MLKTGLFFFILVILFFAKIASFASVDVLKYTIHLSFDKLNEEKISGYTDILLKRTDDSTIFRFDLEKLKIKSASIRGKNVIFQQDTAGFIVILDKAILPDTATLKIVYEGQPGKPSWFGGIYFSETFVYNLGVAIDRVPHTYGKVWFPCKDNFTDKALFEYFITVPKGKTAVCNGNLIDVKYIGDKSTFHWRLNQPIPTYLASFAISEYVEVKDTYTGITGNKIPISIYVNPGKEKDAVGSFKNLKKTLKFFEDKFGPYRWDRIGYVAVPMTGGAMEHATNIAYPKNFINSETKYDRLWAHELSHSWFGNLVTCATSGDMWLNEGFARYAEVLHTEAILGPQKAKDYMRKIQRDVLISTHKRDKGYFAVAPVSEINTYSSTVYDKGSTIVHTLKNYLGEKIFFDLVKKYMSTFAFKNASTKEFQDFFSISSGKNLDSFFQGWVYAPGHVLFAIDSVDIRTHHLRNTWMMNICIRQILLNKPNFISDNEVDLLLLGNKGERKLVKFNFSGETSAGNFILNFKPVGYIVDPDEKICDGSVDQFLNLESKATIDITGSDCIIHISKGSKNANGFMRYRISPAFTFYGQGGQGYMSTKHWSVEGYLPDDLQAEAIFKFDLKNYFPPQVVEQHTLNPNDITNIGLFYRRNPTKEWKKISVLTKYDPKELDNVYELKAPKLEVGEYCVGFLNE